MGTYFHYVNHTRRERFRISALGGGDKFSCVGRTLAARAFEVMLTWRGSADPPDSSDACCCWGGDEVAVIGDDLEPDWEAIRTGYVDIGANVILMLIRVDGFDQIGKQAEDNTSLFMQLCHLATTGQSKPLEKELERHFGKDFRRRYKQLCEERGWFEPLNVVKGGS